MTFDNDEPLSVRALFTIDCTSSVLDALWRLRDGEKQDRYEYDNGGGGYTRTHGDITTLHLLYNIKCDICKTFRLLYILLNALL